MIVEKREGGIFITKIFVFTYDPSILTNLISIVNQSDQDKLPPCKNR